jgi:predicted esterase
VRRSSETVARCRGMVALASALFVACSPPTPRPPVGHSERSKGHDAAWLATNDQATAPSTTAPSTTAAEADADPEISAEVRLLELEGTPPPLLVLPAATAPRPLVVSAHGAGGSPEWDCGWLTTVLPEPAVQLCLRGIPMGRGGTSFYYPEHHSLGRWLRTSREAVQKDYASRLTEAAVYVAYSQGATMGALALQTTDSAIASLLLIEGGTDGWTIDRSRRFRQSGGRRVYFACGTSSCHTKAKAAAARLRDAGVETHVRHAEGAGHTPLGAVSDLVRDGLRWLLQDTPPP